MDFSDIGKTRSGRGTILKASLSVLRPEEFKNRKVSANYNLETTIRRGDRALRISIQRTQFACRRSSPPSAARASSAPQWLLDLVLPPTPQVRHDFSYTPTGNGPYVEAAVKAEVDKLASTGPGSRGYQLNASMAGAVSTPIRQPRAIPDPSAGFNDNTRLVDVKRVIENVFARRMLPTLPATDRRRS